MDGIDKDMDKDTGEDDAQSVPAGRAGLHGGPRRPLQCVPRYLANRDRQSSSEHVPAPGVTGPRRHGGIEMLESMPGESRTDGHGSGGRSRDPGQLRNRSSDAERRTLARRCATREMCTLTADRLPLRARWFPTVRRLATAPPARLSRRCRATPVQPRHAVPPRRQRADNAPTRGERARPRRAALDAPGAPASTPASRDVTPTLEIATRTPPTTRTQRLRFWLVDVERCRSSAPFGHRSWSCRTTTGTPRSIRWRRRRRDRRQ